MGRGELKRRAHLVWAFALLVVVCASTPVLAEMPEALEPPATESPQAVAERESSEYAYVDLTPAQEEELLREHFAPQLEAIAADPARALDDVVINRIDSPTEALVTVEGEKALLESEVPLRAPEEDGDLHKVELELEATPSGFEPANPLVDLTLPERADEPIEVGDQGLTITPLGTSDAPASPLGEEDLFLPAAREDTSFLLSPVAGGLELSALLASRNSPQQLAFAVGLPQGATLRADGAGGAEAVDAQGEQIARITAPYAIDSQGSEVPVALSVEGSTMTLSIPHSELDVAYPLFVDPEFIQEDFVDASKFGYWKWSWSGVGAEDFIGRTSCIVTCWSHTGLYVRARANFTYPAGSWGRFWFTPQGSTTYMRRVVLGPINYDTHGCSANEPHAYVGVWNDNGNWSVLANAYPSGWGSYIDTGSQNLGPGTRTAFVGMHSNSTTSLACGRDYRLGGATLFLSDPEQPTVGATWGYPSGWVKSGATITVNGTAHDPGLGVKKGKLHLGGSVDLFRESACTGSYASPCLSSHTFSFAVGAGSLDEGEKNLEFSAEDVLGKSSSNSHVWPMKVDRTPPEIELGGQLAQATDEGDLKDEKDQALSLPVYNLQINATDGKNPATGAIAPGEKRSGVKKIEVFLDERTTPEATYEATSCPSGNCPLSKTFALKLNELEAGEEHTLRILARDFAGNVPRERKIEFEYIPATGMKEEYVMQYFPLPDGSGDEEEEEHPRRPELAVNLVNGNLVYRQKDVEVETASADLEVELFYNSLLPESQNTEWGDGWTMAEEPALEIEDPGAAGGPTEATIVEESGAVESSVDLPAAVGGSSFDKRIQATVTKEADGGFEVTDESGETGDSLEFSPSGRLEEVENGTSATVDYAYEEGDLAEISIEDPGTASVAPGSLDEDQVFPDLAIGHSANFGTAGTADGQLKAPADVVADAQGNLYVLDRDNHRVQKLSPDGAFLAKFGGSGTANGKFGEPSAIALDGAGNLWIADTGNHRVQKLSPSGQFLAKFGEFSFEAGGFWSPSGIAIAGDGSIWVSDVDKVQRFTPTGQFIERVGASGPGAVAEPQSLATDPAGNVLVADSGSDRVSVFEADGDFVRTFGSPGTGPGQLQKPVEVDVDSDGNAWIADSQAGRVQLFNASGDYVAQFGGTGAGAAQFKLSDTSGLVVDRGRVWIGDSGNNRVQRWLASPFTSFIHSANFGSAGTADGQLKAPADVVADAQGNLYVLDRDNHRVQKFAPDGTYLAKFGGYGSANGKFGEPSAIALDGAGNLWIADTGNHRVQKLSPSGQFLAKFGEFSLEAGGFWSPSGIAVGADGSIWVSDLDKVQRFTAGGQFIERVGANGPGEVAEPQSLDTAPDGSVLVADSGKDRLAAFSKDGDFLRAFGSAGNGPGQLQKPAELDVDSEGNVWVADSQANRVQLFNAGGDYVAQFGSVGSGADQLKLNDSAGIAVDRGRVWVSDAGNNRVAEWVGGNYDAPSGPVPTEDDPQLEIDVSEGLVDSVEGEEAGTVDYDHSGDLLTSVEGPETGADFEYDEKERLKKVTLANGTYAAIAYEPTYGRVKSVTVAPQGANAKTTFFNYSDEPRRTVVTAPNAPIATYDFAADGSVFKWWSSAQPPVFDDIAGSLYDPANRETSEPIPLGAHTLNVQAHSAEGIASIQVVANNNQLVDEKTCTFDPAVANSCATVSNEWVTETGNWPPGILHLEVIITDRLGRSASQRLWVNVPYTPPPDPEAEEAPRFGDVLRFREEFGLDLDLKGNEAAINDRVFDLIGAWHNPATPAGEVARATVERWGVPLRPIDISELEYRDFYIPHDTEKIRKWGEQQVSGSYAGYYVDNRAGGTIYVALLGDETSRSTLLSSLATALRAPLRVKSAPGLFVRTLAQLRAVERGAINEALSHPELDGEFGGAYIDVPKNHVAISMINPAKAETILKPKFGAALKVNQGSAPVPRPAKFSRYNNSGPVQAGDLLLNEYECTAGFGAWDTRDGKTKATGDDIYVPLQLTAGHCWKKGLNVWRGEPGKPLGKVTRNNYVENGTMTLDAATISTTWSELGRSIYINRNREKGITGYATPVVGQSVCVSGERTNKLLGKHRRMRVCGPVLDQPREYFVEFSNGTAFRSVEIPVAVRVSPGDSGGPAWIAGTGQAAGLITGAYDGEYGYGDCTDLFGGEFGMEDQGEYICPITGITSIQQIVTGAQSLYNAEKLSNDGVAFAEPLYIGGLALQK